MKHQKKFVVVEGMLSEDMEFKKLRGYEVNKIRLEDRKTDINSKVVVQLLDKNNQLLTMKKMDIRFPQGCNPATSLPGTGFVRAALLRHQDAKLFVIIANDRIIYSEKIGTHEVEINNIAIESACNKETIKLSFNTEQGFDGDIELFVEETSGRRFPVASNLENNRYEIDLLLYAGRGTARIVVRATSDLRSSEAYSKFIPLPDAKLNGRILSPRDSDEWVANQPCSILGNLFDNNGRRISWNSKEMHWFLDEKKLEDKKSIVLCDSLEPGEHKLELRHGVGSDNTTLLDHVHFSVQQESEAQKEYELILKEYLIQKNDVITNG